MRNVQIGVIGSMADIKLAKRLIVLATQVGAQIAKQQAVLVYGFEGDFDSISTAAARSAQQTGGKTIAFCWGNNKPDMGSLNSIVIVTGQQRGGGREFSLILSCDVLIVLSGGSGTLMEIAMAYQANIPVVVLAHTAGWADKLSGTFLDKRKRFKIAKAVTPIKAVKSAIELAHLSQKEKKVQ